MININLGLFISFLMVGSLLAEEAERYWIFFTDKNSVQESSQKNDPASNLSERSLRRRQLRVKSTNLNDSDRPVSGEYIRLLESSGVRLHHQSKWFNAVSCYLNGIDPVYLEKFDFIQEIRPVKSLQINLPVDNSGFSPHKQVSSDYGSSFNQNEMIGIPAAHELGYSGENVLIAVFDTGFLLAHEAFNKLNVIDSWDFVNNDGNINDEAGDLSGQQNHGSKVLGVMAGYQPGQLIGPAHAAQYLLAKTEDLKSETHVEEDNWVAAAEWAEALGADIISSSLNYLLDYTYDDMDGNSTLITQAADMAVEKGMAVFSAAGNEGSTSWKYIAAPADGQYVMAIGGVRADGSRWPTSSIGPTSDGRIKPDLMAQGQSVVTINPATQNDYIVDSGTSYSCALGAGAGAILLSALPDLSPLELRDILLQHASQSAKPDNILGYGLIDLKQIISGIINNPGVSVRDFKVFAESGKNILRWIAEREIENDRWMIRRESASEGLTVIASVNGRKLGTATEEYTYTDFNVNGSEIFVYQVSALLSSGEEIMIDSARVSSKNPEELVLLNNSPNPFNSETRITFGIDYGQKVSLKVFNVNGQIVARLIDDQYYEGQYHHLIWDATNDAGEIVSSGVYLLQLRTDSGGAVIRLVYLK